MKNFVKGFSYKRALGEFSRLERLGLLSFDILEYISYIFIFGCF